MNKPTNDMETNPSDAHEEQDDAIIGQAFKWSAVVILVLALCGVAAAYVMTRPKPPEEVDDETLVLPKKRNRLQAQPPKAVFVDITGPAGITFKHENGATGEKLLPETMGGGCAFLDFDNDDDQDILFVNSNRWPWDTRKEEPQPTMALYRNDGKAHFSDVTEEFGLNVSFYGMGAAVGDYDADGDVDIFISAVGANHLFRNDGERFVDVTEEAGVAGEETEWGTSSAWFDYNNDGRLDLFVGNYVAWSKKIDLGQDFRIVGGGRAYGPPTHFDGSFPYLYRNDGEGKFTDVSEEAGIRTKNFATGVAMAKMMGVAPIDVDGDGWLDIICANDTVQNFLYHNQQDGTFVESGTISGIAFDSEGLATGAMGIDTGRFRNDSTLGVAIGNFATEMTALYAASDNSMGFLDLAIASGLGPQTRLELTFGLFFFDYDLDGRLDMLCSNGHLEEEISKVQASQQYEQPPQLFWNCGPDSPTEFAPVKAGQCGSDLLKRMVGRGSAFADIDNDGDLDVLLMEVGGTPRLLRNDQQLGRHWVRLKLIGVGGNLDAIGSWIEVHVGDQVLQRQVMPTRSYLSQVELPVTIGIGDATVVNKVVIHWSNGSRQEVHDVKVDELTKVRQLSE